VAKSRKVVFSECGNWRFSSFSGLGSEALLAERFRTKGDVIINNKDQFPKAWHGGFVIVVGLSVGIMGAAGWLGKLPGPDQLGRDMNTAVFFLLVGFCLALLGLVLLLWGARRSLRSDTHEVASGRPNVFSNELYHQDEGSTLRILFSLTVAAVLLGATDERLWILLQTGPSFRPLSPIRKFMFFTCGFLLSQLPFLVALVRLREKVDRLAIALLFAYSCVSVLASAQMFRIPFYPFSWRELLLALEIAIAVFAWQARNKLPRRDGENSLLLACFVASLVYLKVHFWLNPLLYFKS